MDNSNNTAPNRGTEGSIEVERATGPILIARSAAPVLVERSAAPVPIERPAVPVPIERPAGLISIKRLAGSILPAGPIPIERPAGPVPIERSAGPIPRERSPCPISFERSAGPSPIERPVTPTKPPISPSEQPLSPSQKTFPWQPAPRGRTSLPSLREIMTQFDRNMSFFENISDSESSKGPDTPQSDSAEPLMFPFEMPGQPTASSPRPRPRLLSPFRRSTPPLFTDCETKMCDLLSNIHAIWQMRDEFVAKEEFRKFLEEYEQEVRCYFEWLHNQLEFLRHYVGKMTKLMRFCSFSETIGTLSLMETLLQDVKRRELRQNAGIPQTAIEYEPIDFEKSTEREIVENYARAHGIDAKKYYSEPTYKMPGRMEMMIPDDDIDSPDMDIRSIGTRIVCYLKLITRKSPDYDWESDDEDTWSHGTYDRGYSP
ncbi:MAG: hypothetical protein Q9160_009272 [Pyrenula sp. 1 TL-2023]